MKIFMGDTMYVQKNDILFLSQTDVPIPASIYMKVLGKGVVDDRNRYNFVKFEEYHDIAFFKNIDWIIDYDQIRYLDDDKIIQLCNEIADLKNNIVEDYNSMTYVERSRNVDMFFECEKLDYKMYSLRDYLLFKQGQLNFKLPKGIDSSDGCKINESKGFRRILSKFKKNNK